MKNNDSREEVAGPNPSRPETAPRVPPRTRKVGPTAVAFVIGLAALTAQASESDLVRDIQRYCTVCWRNARLDPRLWDDCTQEVCCRLLTKARDGQLDLTQVLAEDTPGPSRTGPGHRHGPEARAADQAVTSRSTDSRRRRPTWISASAIGSSSGRSSNRPAVRCSASGRIASSSSGCAVRRSRKSVPSSTCRSPGSATRSTRPCESWNNTSSSSPRCPGIRTPLHGRVEQHDPVSTAASRSRNGT